MGLKDSGFGVSLIQQFTGKPDLDECAVMRAFPLCEKLICSYVMLRLRNKPLVASICRVTGSRHQELLMLGI